MGLPDLTPSEIRKVREGNLMLKHCLEIIRVCLQKGIRGYLEQSVT